MGHFARVSCRAATILDPAFLALCLVTEIKSCQKSCKRCATSCLRTSTSPLSKSSNKPYVLINSLADVMTTHVQSFCLVFWCCDKSSADSVLVPVKIAKGGFSGLRYERVLCKKCASQKKVLRLTTLQALFYTAQMRRAARPAAAIRPGAAVIWACKYELVMGRTREKMVGIQ